MAAQLEQAYSYAFASQVHQASGGSELLLATSDRDSNHPYFFQGAIVRPRVLADLFIALMDVVQARFHIPAGSNLWKEMADPVVTSSDDRLRLEAFSSCCGIYARVDLTPEAVIGETFGRGTTNVDFNRPMMEALRRIRQQDAVALSVGADEVKLSTDSGDVVEKKVELPVRWLKAFVEVQSYQSRMVPIFEIPKIEAVRFIRGLPKMKTHRRKTWIVEAGRGLRLSQVQPRVGVSVGGLERLRLLERLMPHVETLRVYGDETTGASAWELHVPGARFHLIVSPEVWRGFSGEGQALIDLATADRDTLLQQVHGELTWDAVVDSDRIAQTTGIAPDDIRSSLAVLGARGLVGFDLEAGAYFHRELPFDLSLVEKLQPRLQNARKLIDSGGIRFVKQAPPAAEAYVPGTDVEHRVIIDPNGEGRCTCPWYHKHHGDRGPCKHILAVQILMESREG